MYESRVLYLFNVSKYRRPPYQGNLELAVPLCSKTMVSVWLLARGAISRSILSFFFERIIGQFAWFEGTRNFRDNDLEVVSHTDRPKYLIGLYY